MDILNLGAGNKIIAGAVNHDLRKHRPEITVSHDLNVVPWPWCDNSFDLIIACAVLEHLDIDLLHSFNECWRILRPGGILHVKLPWWQADSGYADPTHRWHLSLQALDVFDPNTRFGKRYSFYTPCKWKIMEYPKLNKGHTSFAAKLQVRK